MVTSHTVSSVAARSVPVAAGAAPGRGPADGPRPWNAEQARMLLASHPENVRDTRCWLRAVMAGWAVSEDSAESAVLLLSELVSNAVLHAHSCRVLVTARLRWGLLECEVEDQDPRWGPGRTEHEAAEGGAPTSREPVGGEAASLRGSLPPDTALEDPAESGRGIPLLDALAGAWGVRSHSRGKSVWFVLPTRPHSVAAITARPPDSSADARIPGHARRSA